MATFNWTGAPTINPDLRCGGMRIMGNYAIPTDGAVVGTNKLIGILPAGASVPGTAMYTVTKIAGTNTDTIATFLVPRSTQTIDTTALMPTGATTATTTGQYFNTAANVKSAGRFDKLTEDCAVIVQYSAADGTGTVGSWDIVLPFHHTFDLTAY